MQIIKKRKANALITVLAVLLVISTMAVSFARVAGSERLAASNYGEALKVRLLSEAGLNFGISQLRRDFQQEVMCTVQAFTDKTGELKGERRWTYTALNDENPTNLTATNMHLVEDDMAAGIPLENLQRVSTDDNPIKSDSNNPQLVSPHPSYALMDQTTDLPQKIPNTNLMVTRAQKTLPNATVPTYTLKIISLNSQIDLNSQTPQFGQAIESLHLATMLNNLSIAISQREPYRTKFPEDIGKGPLFSTVAGEDFLGQEILSLREKMTNKRFTSKYQILELEGMDAEKAVYLWDFICASPRQQVVLARPAVLQNPNIANPQSVENPPVNELEEYRTDTRSPININLAPWPVLVAVFSGLECVDSTGLKITITNDDAQALAARICRERRRDRRPESLEDPTDFEYPFTEWEKFKKYLLRPHNETGKIAGGLDVFSGSADLQRKKALLVYAMADPNVHLRRTNPDEVLFQEINKTDINKPTMELSFYPYGLFEITSLGQIITTKGNIVNSHKRQVVVKIFDLIKKNSQDDFNFEHVLASTDGALITNFKEINSYSSGNNVNLIDNISEVDLVNIVSHEFGHIAPVNFENKFLGSSADADTFNTNKPDSGEVLFRCNFNGDNLVSNGGIIESPTPYTRTLNADFPLPGENTDSPEGGRLIEPANGLTSKKASKSILPKEQDCGNPDLIGDLASDGVVFFENPDSQFTGGAIVEDRTLCYLTKNNMPMPSTLTGFETDGTVSFWFKLNENKDWNKFRTIFFGTTPMTDDGSKGVQMEIQMKPDIDGSLVIQARRKFYDVNSPLEREVDIEGQVDIYTGSPKTMAFIDTGAQKAFTGIQNHKWYNVCVRWQQVTLVEENDIILFGDIESENTVNIAFEAEDPFNDTSTNLVNLPLDETLLDEDLQLDLEPLDATEILTKNNARMYFGTVKRTYKPGANGVFGDADDISAIFSTACTIDDIRITETRIPNTLTASRFSPTGFVHQGPGVDDETFNIVGMFSGEFSGIDANRTVLGVFDWTRRVPKEFDDGSFKDQPFTQGEFEEGDFDGGNNLSSTTEYISKYQTRKQQAIQIKFSGIDEDVLDAIGNAILGDDRGESVFGRPIGKDEFRRLFAKEIKKVWNRFAKEQDKGKGKKDKKFTKVQELKDSKILGFVIKSAQSKARKILRDNPDLLNRLINLKQEIANSLANGEQEETISEEVPVTQGNGGIPIDFENIGVDEQVIIERIENKAEGFLDDISQKAFAVKALNPLEAPLVPIAKSLQPADDGEAGEAQIEKVIISPENANFQYNLMFLQAKKQNAEDSEDSSAKVAFSSPVIDDVSISFQSKILFFYNIELLD